MRWFEQQPKRWSREQAIANRLMADVMAGVDDAGRAFIAGTYRLLSRSGHEYDRFNLRFVYPDRFPLRNRNPNVYLDSHHDVWQFGRDSHIEPTWRMCLFVPLESGIDFNDGDSLLQLFPLIHTFLIRERIYQRDWKREAATKIAPVWPGPDRSHGSDGLVEAILAHGGLGRNEPCVCGSGEKFKRCCLHELEPQLKLRRASK